MSVFTSMCDAALFYATECDFAVLPVHGISADRTCTCGRGCVKPGKHPLLAHGVHEASKDSKTIEQWFSRWPNANVAIATGRVSGIVVLDVDSPEAEKLVRPFLTGKVAPRVLTGKDGGSHRYYACPDVSLQNRTGVLPNVDFRGDAGYVLAPPSNHVSGATYLWQDSFGLNDVAPPQMPSLLVGLLVRPARQKNTSSPAWGVQRQLIPNGCRNSTLTSMVGSLCREGRSYKDVLDEARRINLEQCSPPLEDEEVCAIVRSIERRESKRRGVDASGRHLPSPAGLTDAVTMARDQVAQAMAEATNDRSDAIHWRWPSVEKLSGAILPGELVVIGGRPGSGKTTFLLNEIDYLTENGVGWVFAGMEMTAPQLRRQWAAWKCELELEHVLTNDWKCLPVDARERMMHHLQWQCLPDVAPLTQFVPASRIGVADLQVWSQRAADDGCKVLIIDHFHRMDFGGRQENALHLKSEAVRTAKELAVRHQIAIIMAAQLNRGNRDALELYYPAPLNALKDCGTLEEEADRVLMLHRVLKTGLNKVAIQNAKEGGIPVDSVSEPNTIGVCCRKNRRNGLAVDKAVQLRIERGVISERAK